MTGQYKIVYMLGIGGIGMSALARYFNHMGYRVEGYDKTPSALTQALSEEGIKIHFEDKIEFMPQELVTGNGAAQVLIIYTPAIPKNHAQFNFILDKKYTLYKRAQVLGMITKQSKCITVAGTHGKTTTSTLIAHIMKEGTGNVSAFLGGISSNYKTNLLLGDNNAYTVIEADEYDRSFLQLYPLISVITSMDPDHLDIYGSPEEMAKTYNQFAHQVSPEGKLIVRHGLNITATPKLTYGFNKNADYFGTNIRITDGHYTFDIVTKNRTIQNIQSGLPGRHNVENAIAAFAAAEQAGLSDEAIKKAIYSYSGVKRRFEYAIKTSEVIFIDDYAHHPEELKACINSAKEMYPDKKITGIFQPHLFSRTKDFADEFAAVLDLLDECILLDIYPARELPMEGITSQWLMGKMEKKNAVLLEKDKVVNYVTTNKPQVLLTLGAGDIDRLVEPIKNALAN